MTWYFVNHFVVWLCVTVLGGVSATRVWLDDHGKYQNLVVAVHPSLSSANCTELFTNLQNAASRFSAGLQTVTDGRIGGIGRLQVVLPRSMAQLCHLTHLPLASWQRWSTADIRLVPESSPWERWSPEDSAGVGVRQVQGCSRPADYITLAVPSLLRGNVATEDQLEVVGRSLVSGWARYRWGVFEERGYQGDPRFPLADDCPQDSITNCTQRPVTSLLQKVTSSEPIKFCDIGTHDYESENLHNLACFGRSVSEVIHHHQDLAPPHQRAEGVEVVRPHSGLRVVDPRHFHVEGDIRKYLKTKKKYVKLSNNENVEESAVAESSERNISSSTNSSTDVVFDIHNVAKLTKDLTQDNLTAQVNWQNVRARRAVPFKDVPDPEIEPPTTELVNISADYSASAEINDTLVESSGEFNETSTELPSNYSRSSSSEMSEQVNTTASAAVPIARLRADPHLAAVPIARLRADPHLAPIRPDAEGFSAVPLELLVAPPPVVVISLDLSQTAVDEVGVDTLRGGLLRWMWGLGGGSRLSIIAAYNNESFPLTLSPLPPSPRTATQLESRLALLPTEQEAATGVYGGRYCLSCVLEQAAQLVAQGGANVESSVLVVAACRPKVGATEKKILAASRLTLHTVALCSTAEPEFDQLADEHSSWVLPSNSGPQDGQRQLARILQAIMLETTSSPMDTMFAQLHEKGRYVERSELESSGAYALVGGEVHLGSSSTKRLLVLSATSPAKVVEIRDSDGRRLEAVRDTGRRFWLELSGSGTFSYTFKFLSTSLNFPLHVSEDIYDQRTGESGLLVTLRTSTNAPLVPGSPPMIVWATVIMDGWPVVGAAVTLTVTHLPSGIVSNYSLLDSGNTDPDLRSEDGVYSRYLTWRLGEGRYSLTARAQHSANTFMVTTQRDGRIQRGTSGPFTAVSAARTMYVARVNFEDTAPPSRITDLSAHLVQHAPHAVVNISWSAPGGDLDQGSASRYELKMYTERLALTEERFNESGIFVYCLVDGLRSPPPPPGLYGAPQHCLARVPFTDLKWYFAVRGVDAANNTGRVSNIVWLLVPKPPPTTSAASIHAPPSLTTVDDAALHNVTAVSSQTAGAWRPYVVAGAAVLGLLMVGAAALACFCCCRKAKARKEKDPDRPVYKIYVNNAYIQEDDGEIKVVQEWVNSLDKYGNVEREVPGEKTELKNKASFKYTSPVRFGVLTNGSIMRDATTGSTNSSGSSSRPSDEAQHDDYKYRDLSETTSDSTTDGLPPSSTSSAATNVLPVEGVSASVGIASAYPSPAKSLSLKNTNISSLPLPSPRKNPPATPPLQSQPAQLSLHTPVSQHDYTSEEEGGFRSRNQHVTQRGSPIMPRRQLPQHFSSFRYLPPPPQYRSTEFTQYTQPQSSPNQPGVIPIPPIPHQHSSGGSQQHSPAGQPMQRVNGSLSHGTVRSVKKRRHISFV